MMVAWPSAALRNRIRSSTRRQPGAAVGPQLQRLRLHQPRHLLAHQGGRQVPTCQVLALAWLAFISQPLGNFMVWGDALRMLRGAISRTRLNMIPAATAGLSKRQLIRTTRSTTWLAAC